MIQNITNTSLLQSISHRMDNDMRNLFQILVFLSCNNGHVVNEIPHICHCARKLSEKYKPQNCIGEDYFSQLILL